MYILSAGDSIHKPIFFMPWNEFRIVKSLKYTDMWYRHLHCNRS